MRDAFGGVFMIRLFLVFLFIYVAFTAVSLNYARAFRVKNKVIDFIEEKEILSLSDLSKYEEELESILTAADYTKKCNGGNTKVVVGEEPQEYCIGGVLIKKNMTNIEHIDSNNKRIYYQVNTYADWNLGTLNLILSLSNNNETGGYVSGTWEITGEAIVVDKYNK